MADTYSVSYTPASQESGTSTSTSTSSDSAPMIALKAGPSYTCKIATIQWAYSGLSDDAVLDLGLQRLDAIVRRTNAAGGRSHKLQRRAQLAQRDFPTASIAMSQALERKSFTWNTYVAPGTYRWVAIVENQDVTTYSSAFMVTDSGDSSCVDSTLFSSSSVVDASAVNSASSSAAAAFSSSAAEIASSIAASSSASAAPAGSTSAAAGLGSTSASSTEHTGISSGGIAAAVVVPLLVIAAAVVLYLRRRASSSDSLNEKSSGNGGSGSWKEKFLGGSAAAASGGHLRSVSAPFDPRQHTGLSSQGTQAGMRRADAGDVLPGTDGAEWVDFSATNSPDARVLSPGQFAHIPEGTEAAARNSAFSDSIIVGDAGVSGGIYKQNKAPISRDSVLSGAAHYHKRFDSQATNSRPSSVTSRESAAKQEAAAEEAAALQRSVSSASSLQVRRKPVPEIDSKHVSSAARSSVDPYSLPNVASPSLPSSAFPDASPFSDAHAAVDSHISGVPDNVQSVDTPVLPERSSPTHSSPASRTLVTVDSSEEPASPQGPRGDYHLSVNMDKGFRVSF